MRPTIRRLLTASSAVLAAAAAVVSVASASPVYHDTSYWYDPPPWCDWSTPVIYSYNEDGSPNYGCMNRDDPPYLIPSGYYTYSPDNTERPALSGDAREKAVLSTTDGVWTNDAANDDPTNVYTYRWQICSSAGTDCADIPDATASTYTIPSGSQGKTVRAIVRATNASGHNESSTLVSAIVTLPIPSPDPSHPPKLPAAAANPIKGTSITATRGSWSDASTATFAYQWQRCAAASEDPDEADCVDIADAHDLSYTPTAADVGSRLRLVVSAHNEDTPEATANSAFSGQVKAPAPTLPPSSSDPSAGEPLTATQPDQDDGSPTTYTYQWQRCEKPSADPAIADCVDIPGATNSTYTPTADDVGKYLRVVVTAHNPGMPDATSTSAFTGKVKATPPPVTAPLEGGGGAAPGGGGGGGGGGKAGADKGAESTGGGSSGGSSTGGGKDRGALNGPGATDDAALKVVFSATKTTTLSTTYGKGAVISGRLTTKSGDPLAKAKIDVTARLSGGSRFDDRTVVTDDDGRFSVTLPGNVQSQTVRVSYRSHINDEQAAAAASLALSVRARAQLTVTASGTKANEARATKGKKKKAVRRSIARNGSMLTFRAQVVGPIPVGGKTVQLQSQCRAKGCAKGWANFGPSGQRTDSKGRFVWRVRTNGTVGTVTYRFRLVVPEVDGASNDWPFSTGYSPVRSLTIQGGGR